MLARRLGSIRPLVAGFGQARSHLPLADPRLLHAPLACSSWQARQITGSVPGVEQSPSPRRVVLLSGFLGAGKTTVLEQLLREEHGYKLGVVVNDLASVNVDANVLQDAVKSAGAQSMSLQNGCVCCTAADDLRDSVKQLLTQSSDLDAIVIELSGVAEPARAKQILEAPALEASQESPPVSVRTVTVVDTPAFARDYLAVRSGQKQQPGECDERHGSLLAEQIEAADLLLFNKEDVASSYEMGQAQALAKALNEVAQTRVTQFGRTSVGDLLAIDPEEKRERAARAAAEDVASTGSADDEDVANSTTLPKCCVKKTCSSANKASTTACSAKTRAETRFGITSFVYRTERVMSRAKLMRALQVWQNSKNQFGDRLDLHGLGGSEAGEPAEAEQRGGAVTESPLDRILRSKGLLLMDSQPEVAYYWSHAGKSLNFSTFGPWSESEAALQAAPQSRGGLGAPRTEVVFIGQGYDEAAVRELLDSCLLTVEDMAFLKKMRAPSVAPSVAA